MAKSVIERFEEKVMVDPNSGCWLWTAHIMKNGYGTFQMDPKNQNDKLAHRAAYRLYVGPIPDGMELDHKCRVRCCVNPHHLEPVTRIENIRRGIGPLMQTARYMQRTHCRRGHELTPDNLRVLGLKGGKKQNRCLACCRITGARHDAKRRQRKARPC